MSLTLQKKYPAYTLLELLVVLSIFAILGAMSFSSFGGLQNTVKMNEYVLTLEQDVRSVQRSAMLLQRSPDERWLYGLGIDFGHMGDDGTYTVFKWCSPFGDYGDIMTKSSLPNYDPGYNIGEAVSKQSNGYMPFVEIIPTGNTCEISALFVSELKTVPGYDKTSKTPKATIGISIIRDKTPRYVVFESVSGRAFFYDTNGELLNYTIEGKLVETPESFVITIDPVSNTKTRKISVGSLSGKISTEVVQ